MKLGEGTNTNFQNNISIIKRKRIREGNLPHMRDRRIA
jgi:hypothetical protein